MSLSADRKPPKTTQTPEDTPDDTPTGATTNPTPDDTAGSYINTQRGAGNQSLQLAHFRPLNYRSGTTIYLKIQ